MNVERSLTVPQGLAVIVEEAVFRRAPGRGFDILRQDQLQLSVVPVHLDGVESLVNYRPWTKVSMVGALSTRRRQHPRTGRRGVGS